MEVVLKPHIDSYWQTNEGSATMQIEWDPFKATTRGIYRSAIKPLGRSETVLGHIFRIKNRNVHKSLPRYVGSVAVCQEERVSPLSSHGYL